MIIIFFLSLVLTNTMGLACPLNGRDFSPGSHALPYPLSLEASVKKIPLGGYWSKRSGMCALVDDDDYGWIREYSWRAFRPQNKTCYYAVRTCLQHEKENAWRMHQAIMVRHKLIKKGQPIDHKNGNTLDNRKVNLRPCTTSQNFQNAKKQRNCTSKYKGVCWHKSARKWVAYAGPHGKQKTLGHFENEKDAARAYDEYARKNYGEFARLNNA